MSEVVVEREELVHFTEKYFNNHVKTLGISGPMLDGMREAFSGFRELSMPHKGMEEWRRTDISRIKFNDFIPLSAEEIEYVSCDSDLDGSIRFEDSGVKIALNKELEAKGVILDSLFTALDKYPDLVEKYFNKTVTSPEFDKFRLWNTSFFNRGIFLYIPDGLVIEKPIEISYGGEFSGRLVIPRHVIALGKNARALIKIEYRDIPGELALMVNAVDEIYTAENSFLELLSLQNLRSNAYYFGVNGSVQKRDSFLNWNSVIMGGKLSKSYLGGELVAPGADTKLNGIFYANKKQHFDIRTMQVHHAGRTQSDLLFKGVVQEKGHTIYQGMIQVDKDAQQINAYQTNKNLILNQGARADSIPGLEILADDVRCSHGATIGHVNPEEIFYLKSRGIKESEAKRMIIAGFLEDVLDRVHDDSFKEFVRELIDAKMNV